MTREEAKQLLPIIQAYVDGKTIQYRDKKEEEEDDWVSCNSPEFDLYNCQYRIEPERTYRPFKDEEECWEEMKEHEPFGWLKSTGDGEYFHFGRLSHGLDKEFYFNSFTFADGTPFGKLTEEE